MYLLVTIGSLPRNKVYGTYGIQDLWNNATTTILYVFMVYCLINWHRVGFNFTIMNITIAM